MNFEVGQNIHAVFDGGKYEVKGTVIKVVHPGRALSELEMEIYAGLKKGDTAYKSVEGKNCKVGRLILETHKGHTIVPVNPRKWEITLLDHHPEKQPYMPESLFKKMNNKMIGVDYGEIEKKVLAHDSSKVEKAFFNKHQEEVFENFDPYSIVANRHFIKRDVVKTSAYKYFYSNHQKGKREIKALQEVIVAQIEDALELEGLL